MPGTTRASGKTEGSKLWYLLIFWGFHLFRSSAKSLKPSTTSFLKNCLKNSLTSLESLKLVAIWHYLVIALAVATALFLIYIFSRKNFSPVKNLSNEESQRESASNAESTCQPDQQLVPSVGLFSTNRAANVITRCMFTGSFAGSVDSGYRLTRS